MLRIATEEEITQYADIAYELAMDPTRCGYPVYYDGMKTKEEFISKLWRSLREPNRELLLFIYEGRVEGFIQFFYWAADNYLQTEGFSIASHTATALEEFVLYCAEHFSGYELYFGFPEDNREAVAYLREQGWPCIEEDWNQLLHLKDYQPRPESPHIRKVTKDNFEDFRAIHSQYDSGMYWNCQRVYEAIEDWHIYLYDREKKPVGAILYRDKEIFALGFADDKFDEEVYCALLTAAANDHKKRGVSDIVFFENADSPAAKNGLSSGGEIPVLYEADLKKRFEMYYHMSNTLQIGAVTTVDYKNQEELAFPFADAMQYSKDCYMSMVFNSAYLRAVLGKFGLKDMWSHYLKWATEGAFEFIRRTEFSNSYSRIKCNYFYDNLEDIKRLFEEDWGGASPEERNAIHLFEMDLKDVHPQKRDMLLFDKAFDAMAENKDLDRVLDCARRYFSGQHTDAPVWEILSDKPARAVRDMTYYIHD